MHIKGTKPAYIRFIPIPLKQDVLQFQYKCR